jgi:lauroyl/myristoyl acyltransferase
MTFPSIENIWTGAKYFFLLPLFSLFPFSLAYRFSCFLSRVEYRYHSARRELIKREMGRLLQGEFSSKEAMDLALRRYFEVIFCDDVDAFIYLFGFSKRFLKKVKIEGEEHLHEALKAKGGILLSAHYGGGFWALPFLKQRGFKVHFFSADVKKEDYPFKKALYFYHRLRNGVVERASGSRVLFKNEGRKGIIRMLEKGEWVIILFDVPPFLVKERKEISFLGRKMWLPTGILSVAKEMNAPILPFFSFLDDGKHRRICFERPIYVKNEGEGMEACARLIEKRIIERPDHWHFWPIVGHFFAD